MSTSNLYRKRLIPEECILLKDDHILYQSETIIITSWNALKPKKDLHHGISLYCLEDGYKISKFLKEDGSLLYWYCDIISTNYEALTDSYIFTDLLADVIIYEDGFVKVVDIEELTKAYDLELLSISELKVALNILSRLLKLIYSKKFTDYQDKIDSYL